IQRTDRAHSTDRCRGVHHDRPDPKSHRRLHAPRARGGDEPEKRKNSTKPLDHVSPRDESTPLHPAMLGIRILVLVIGRLIFLFGMVGMGLDPLGGSFDRRSIAFAVVGIGICWVGMQMKSKRPPGSSESKS